MGVMFRYCPHMGTDLANAQVVGNNVRCPMHFWHFNTEGQCTKAPPQDAISAEMNISAFETIEKYGLIYFFFGKEVSFDLPDTPYFDEPYCSEPNPVALNTVYEAISLNAFDAQHFYAVHNRSVCGVPKIEQQSPFRLSIKFSAVVMGDRWYDRLMKMVGHHMLDVDIEICSGNIILVTNKSGKYNALLSLLPDSNQSCVMFVNVIREKRHGLLGNIFQKIEMMFYSWLAVMFLKPDMPVLKGMRPQKGALLDGPDDGVVKFWEYFDALPRHSSAVIEEGKW